VSLHPQEIDRLIEDRLIEDRLIEDRLIEELHHLEEIIEDSNHLIVEDLLLIDYLKMKARFYDINIKARLSSSLARELFRDNAAT